MWCLHKGKPKIMKCVNAVNLKWLPPHSADPLPEFQFRDCGFVVSGTGFQNVWLRSVGISIFPALELPDFKISSFGASRFQYFRLRSSSGASKSGILMEIKNFRDPEADGRFGGAFARGALYTE